MSLVDLHSHSTTSDGLLTPTELVKLAAAQGVRLFALTDHDDVDGLAEARAVADEVGISLINGVEISVTWHNRSVHVVGLRIDLGCPALLHGLEEIRAGRATRAMKMAASLDEFGISGSLAGAYRYAANERMIGRAHFARFLVEQGHAKDVKSVFKKFLVKGKPGYVSHRWADMGEAIGWIKACGGVAVLAHPGRYEIGKTNTRLLLTDFQAAGGSAIEVVSGSHSREQYQEFANYAREFGLLASVGSDYHGPGENYLDMGRLPELPSGCQPVWQDWPEAKSAEQIPTQHSALSTQH